MRATQVLETCLYVDDLPAAEEFYKRVLGVEFVSRQRDRQVFFRCGRQMLLLFQPTTSRQANTDFPEHGAFGPSHVAFASTEADLPKWRDWLTLQQVPIEKTIDWPKGGHSLYFRDPAGNLLEIATPKIWNLPE